MNDRMLRASIEPYRVFIGAIAMTEEPAVHVRGLYELRDGAFVHLDEVLLWTADEVRRRLTRNALRSLASTIRKLDAAGMVEWIVLAPSSSTAQ